MTPEDRKALREALAKVKTRAGEPFDAELIGIARFQFNSLCTEDRIRRLLDALEAAERERDALRGWRDDAIKSCADRRCSQRDALLREAEARAEAAEARERRLREALTELVELKALKDRIETWVIDDIERPLLPFTERMAACNDYDRRKHAAWERARAALSAQPAQPSEAQEQSK